MRLPVFCFYFSFSFHLSRKRIALIKVFVLINRKSILLRKDVENERDEETKYEIGSRMAILAASFYLFVFFSFSSFHFISSFQELA